MTYVLRLVFLLVCATGSLFADLLVSRGVSGIDRYSEAGVFLGTLIAPGTGGLVDAQGVAVLPGGELLVGDFAGGILRFSATGTFLGSFAAGADVDSPFDVVYGPDGSVYVASAGAVSNVAKLSEAGAVVDAESTQGAPQALGVPQYLEFGPFLYVTDQSGRLFRHDAVTGNWNSTGTFDNPEGVAYGSDGFVYLVQRISDNVIRMPAGGGPSEIVIPNGAFSGSPSDLEFGPDGTLYISADQIYRYDVVGQPAGVFLNSFGTGGEFLVFTTPVPEPGTGALLGTCLLCLAFAHLRRRN